MNQGFTTVPFKTESHHGLTSINGIAKFSAAGIVLEFEPKLLGLIAGGVKEVRIPISEILDIKFKKNLMSSSSKITIRTHNFSVLAELPNEDGKMTIKLIKDDYERGKNAVEKLQKDIDQYRSQLPPPQMPVSSLFQEDSEDETKQLNSK